jgi:signal transduction histidine kinase
MVEELPVKRAELKSLVELSTLINSSLDIKTVLSNAMACIQTSLNSEASAIFELDRQRGELYFRIALGDAAERAREVRIKVGEGIAGWVAQTGQPLIIQDAQEDPRFLGFVDQTTGFETRSILCVPIVYQGKLSGVVQVLNKIDNSRFDENDLEMLTIIANQIAIALENARLYSRLSKKFALTTEELKSTYEKLIRSERLAALGKLSHGIAHEVRNPVMIIGGFVRRLQKQFLDNSSIRETTDIILRQTERLEQMVMDIESLAKIRRHQSAAMQLSEVVEAALLSVRSQIESQKIQVIKNLSGEIPSIEGDSELLELAVRSILLNAVEAMPSGGSLELGISSKPEGLLLSIRDTGVGIRQEDLPNIFDPFFTSKTQGSGIGLATVHRIISEHSGEIMVNSTPGEGTEVQIRLPCS